MISEKHKCIFLHPNKTGGKSVEYALFGKEPFPGSSDHMVLARYRDRHGHKVDKYFKFVFCRNPWDRLISIYFGRQQLLDVRMPSVRNFIESADSQGGVTVAQVKWIKDVDGKINIDFVGRFENFNEDWKKVCKRLGINKELPHFNKSQHKPYYEYYDDELIEVVRNKYKEDIDYFGYKYR